MPALKPILSWLIITAVFILFAVISGKKLKMQNVAVAALGSALLVLLLKASPPTAAPLGLWAVGSRWLHNFTVFTLLLNFFRQHSRKKAPSVDWPLPQL